MFKVPFASSDLVLLFGPRKRRGKEFPRKTIVPITVQRNGEVEKDQIIWNTLIFLGNLYLLQLVMRMNWSSFGFYNEIEREKRRKPQRMDLRASLQAEYQDV